eukprot:s106_g33.t1
MSVKIVVVTNLAKFEANSMCLFFCTPAFQLQNPEFHQIDECDLDKSFTDACFERFEALLFRSLHAIVTQPRATRGLARIFACRFEASVNVGDVV